MTLPIAAAASARPNALLQSFRKGSKAYDLIAAVPLILWYALSMNACIRAIDDAADRFLVSPDLAICLLLLSKIALVLLASFAIGLLIFRRPPQRSAHGIAPRLAAVLGTFLCVSLPLLPATQVSALWLGISTALILGGTVFACYSILWLGRSFSLVAEARELVTDGPYSRLRHPLYVGEEVAIFGMVIQFISPLAILIVAVQIGCQLYRMHCEEKVLADTFPDYQTYKARTARLLPGVY
ncbi:MAG TPA: isoprenylcysteine carboxylmethyltransferase family protein [Rhizomicrobium sp.]|jgi:protein-S-isoprenylcysteine O-methyltransferase Ste14|nr:isoprenylcysteine carboxylmethyltransferase family protein [Rhizomicrobium sp.]